MRSSLFSSLLVTCSMVALTLTGCQKTLVEKPMARPLADGINAERKLQFDDAFAAYTKAATSPNKTIKSRALTRLAQMYVEGNGTPRNKEKAVSLLEEAHALGNTSATLALADAYAAGDGVTQDVEKAKTLYSSISKTSPAASLKLFRLKSNNSVPTTPLSPADARTIDKAILSYGIQSLDNNSSAMQAIAREYRDGITVNKDLTQAQRWFTMAVEAGNVSAAQELAHLWLDNPEAFASSEENAIQLLEQAAGYGNVNAMLDVAHYYSAENPQRTDVLQESTWLRKAAKAGNSTAMLKLGKLLANPTSGDDASLEGVEWLTKAAQLDSVSAMLELGRFYRDRTFLAPDYEKSFQLFTQAVDQGSLSALPDLADAYLKGQGTTQDSAKARALLEQAAANKQGGAMIMLGDMLLENPSATTEDISKAKEYYELAAQQQLPSALSRLGRMYAEGNALITKDAIKALDYHTQAAKHDYPPSMEYIGYAYARGLGIAQDDAQGFAWFLKAAQAGAPRAMVETSIAYTDGRGTAQDLKAADQWLAQAAKTKPEAIISVARAYEEGKNNAPKKPELAISLYQKAVALGIPAGQDQLNRLARKHKEHSHGGLSFDNIGQMQTLAQQGDAQAQFLLGQAYRDGKGGLTQDSAQAISWYEKAAAQNNADAMLALAEASSVGLGGTQDQKASLAWYEKAAQLGNAQAQFQLGMMYARGVGTESDKAKAAQWLQKSADQGNAAAKAFLQNVNADSAQ